MLPLQEFLASKALEYAPFDPARFPALYRRFLELFPPKSAPTFIHIVGTNGKGSTGRFLALLLKSAGKRVGHFTSPHIHEFRERFWIEGDLVDQVRLEAAHQRLCQSELAPRASYFEYATLLAILLFEGLEYAVMEAGLGGEFDSTTSLSRALSLFTPIGLDHQELLGGTLEAIALTKLRSMARVAIVGEQYSEAILPLAQKVAQERGSQLYSLEENPLSEESKQLAADYGARFPLPSYQRRNFRLALKAMEILGIAPRLERLGALDLSGRMERFEGLVLDVGHNPQAAHALLESLQGARFELIYNTYQEKDYRAILELLKPHLTRVQIFPLEGNARALEREKLEATLKELAIPFSEFQGELEAGNLSVVFGSFSVVQGFKERYPHLLKRVS